MKTSTNTRTTAFTLAELLVAVSITVVLILAISRLLISAVGITTLGHKRMDADSQARQVFDRMAVDLGQMIKRSDVDSYVKGLDSETGNDTIAFFCQAPGYYPSSGNQSSISLVSYRINANKMERMGKGLLWNGASITDKPIIFGSSPTLQTNWPTAVNGSPDVDYELIGPQIFRFEYFYLLQDGTFAIAPGASAGMQGVLAVSVCIAVVDSKSKVLLSDSQITNLGSGMNDYATSMGHGGLLSQWQSSLDVASPPRQAVSGIRLYQRDFYIK